MKTKLRYVYAVLIMIGFAIFVNGLAYIVINRTEVINDEENVIYFGITMKQADAESVLAVVSAEGFDPAFSHLSSYRDISDKRFHELRKAYLLAREELYNYLNEAAHQSVEKPYYMANYEN